MIDVNSESLVGQVQDALLVVGIDGSGKSTFLSNLADGMGFTVLEPTSDEEAKKFKQATIDTPVTEEIVNQREAIYTRLNSLYARDVSKRIKNGEKVACTGNSLVTGLSHSVMRQVIGCDMRDHHTKTVVNWVNVSSDLPGAIAFTYAPFNTIIARIIERQRDGQDLERFWGFNSPLFLGIYQDAWHQAIATIREHTDIACIEFDTSVLSPEKMLEIFKQRNDFK
ncbi:hypothetical protein KBB49_00070 [Candidatus Saccharibacteria bacterium]|mgnify:FL=1|nr:hypothetical protein [Candidatus Saccharibacteria bacterium]